MTFLNIIRKNNYIFSIQTTRPFEFIKKTYIPYMCGIKKRYGIIQTDMYKLYKSAFSRAYEVSNKTSRLNEALSVIKLSGMEIRNIDFYIPFNVKKKKRENGNRKVIIIHPGADTSEKRWSENKYRQLIDKIDTKKYEVIITGTNPERETIQNICREFNNVIIYQDLKIIDLFSLIFSSDYLISCDTGPFIFALALGIKFIVIFKSTPAQYVLGNLRIKQKHAILHAEGNTSNKKILEAEDVYNQLIKLEIED